MKIKTILLLLIVSLLPSVTSDAQMEEKQMQTTFTHPWKGKKVAYFGDSITDPRNSGSKKKWWNWLQEWLGIEPYVYGVSGRQWNNIPMQAEQLKSQHGDDFDAILIFIGTNDFNAGVPVGEWYVETEDSVLAAVHKEKSMCMRRHRVPSMDAGTFRGRINIAMDKLKRMFPQKQIVLLTPIHRAFFYSNDTNIQPTEAYQNVCGEWFDSYVNSVKEAGNIWAVPVIDLNATCGLYPLAQEQLIYFANPATDQLHPNDAGQRRMARTLMYQLLTLPCD